MSLLRRLGKRHLEIAQLWVGTGLAFSGAGAVTTLYFTDWKVVLQYLPYYSGKFEKPE